MSQKKFAVYMAMFAGWYLILIERALLLRGYISGAAEPPENLHIPEVIGESVLLFIQSLPYLLAVIALAVLAVAALNFKESRYGERFWRGLLYVLVIFHAAWIFIDPTRNPAIAKEWLDVFALCVIAVYSQARLSHQQDNG